ncbi:MAG: hypothetical protein ACI4HN_08285 [Ruminococcus sp.]
MASCKDCLHYDVCEARIAADENYPERKYTENNNCCNFKDRTRFVELPCKVGDTVYDMYGLDYKIECIVIANRTIIWCRRLNYPSMPFNIPEIGKTVFLTREEAERAWKR